MGLFNDFLNVLGDKAAPVEPEDYFREDGIRMCGKCHTPKEQFLADMESGKLDSVRNFFGANYKLPATCDCRKKLFEEQEREEKRREAAMEAERRRRDCFSSARDAACTFAVDDRKNPQISDSMLRYAEDFAKMMEGEDRFGLLLYGPVGTGKSFYAAAIANYLLEHGYTAAMTNFTEMVNAIMDRSVDSQRYVSHLMRKDLLIFDDMGVERDTEFMQEQVTAFIDARYKSGRPLIVTTNISMEEIKKPKDLTYRRMYDRLLEICHPVKVDGKSRRRESVIRTYDKRNSLLGLQRREDNA